MATNVVSDISKTFQLLIAKKLVKLSASDSTTFI